MFFFFKQKTAYEMRISDWSSDVCSSDLRPAEAGAIFGRELAVEPVRDAGEPRPAHRGIAAERRVGIPQFGAEDLLVARALDHRDGADRSEIGRASCREECVSTCRSRWSP